MTQGAGLPLRRPAIHAFFVAAINRIPRQSHPLRWRIGLPRSWLCRLTQRPISPDGRTIEAARHMPIRRRSIRRGTQRPDGIRMDRRSPDHNRRRFPDGGHRARIETQHGRHRDNKDRDNRMIPELGHFALALAVAIAAAQAVLPLWGAHDRDARLMAAAPGAGAGADDRADRLLRLPDLVGRGGRFLGATTSRRTPAHASRCCTRSPAPGGTMRAPSCCGA